MHEKHKWNGALLENWTAAWLNPTRTQLSFGDEWKSYVVHSDSQHENKKRWCVCVHKLPLTLLHLGSTYKHLVQIWPDFLHFCFNCDSFFGGVSSTFPLHVKLFFSSCAVCSSCLLMLFAPSPPPPTLLLPSAVCDATWKRQSRFASEFLDNWH